MANQNDILGKTVIPNYLFFSLKHRLILINFNLLLIIIGTKVIDYINEWNLLKNNKVPNIKKYYLNYLNNITKEEVSRIEKIEKQFLSKSLMIFNAVDKNQIWHFFYENPLIFEKLVKKSLKKDIKYCIETNCINFNFLNFFKNMKIIETNGAEEEYLKKIVAKYKL